MTLNSVSSTTQLPIQFNSMPPSELNHDHAAFLLVCRTTKAVIINTIIIIILPSSEETFKYTALALACIHLQLRKTPPGSNNQPQQIATTTKITLPTSHSNNRLECNPRVEVNKPLHFSLDRHDSPPVLLIVIIDWLPLNWMVALSALFPPSTSTHI